MDGRNLRVQVSKYRSMYINIEYIRLCIAMSYYYYYYYYYYYLSYSPHVELAETSRWRVQRAYCYDIRLVGLRKIKLIFFPVLIPLLSYG